MSASVETAKEEQPAEKLNFVRELHFPNVHEICGIGGNRVQGPIGTTGGKDIMWRVCQTPHVRQVPELEWSKAIPQHLVFSSGSCREPRSEQGRLFGRAERRHCDARPYAVGVERGESRGQGITEQPAIVPEGGLRTVSNHDHSDASETWELGTDQLPKVGVFHQIGGMRKELAFPRWKRQAEEFMDKFHEEAMVHILKVFDSKAAELLGSADLIPRKKAMRAIAVGIAGPEESAAPCIKQAAHTFRKKDRGHVVKR